jgi:hypothetical protein
MRCDSLRFIVWAILMTLLLSVTAPLAADKADQFPGHYKNDRMAVEIIATGSGGYRGTIRLGAQEFPFQARADGSRLQGTFDSQGYRYGFSASFQGDELNLVSGGKSYALKRQALAPPNPLAAAEDNANRLAGTIPKPKQPPADAAEPATGAAGKLAGYTVLAAQGAGRTLFALKPGMRSAKEAVLAALRDLKGVFDDKPAVSGAFGDANDKQCHGSFAAKLKGRAVKGFVAAGIGANGAAVTVVYAASDAPPSELAALIGALPVPTKWVSHQLPGGSGTIKLPPDWKITQSTALGSVMASGPSNQIVGLGIGAEVVDPKSLIAPQARASGSMLVAPFSDPATALRNLVPQLSLMSQRQGGPPIKLERIISTSPATAQIPNGRAAWLTAAYLKGTGNAAFQVREVALLECYPVGPLAWGLYSSFASAPESTFEHDLPMMLQIAQSWKLNDAAVTDNSRKMISAQNRNFAAFEQSMKERSQAFDSYMQSVRNNERVREKCNADFDEIIRGHRTVEDTSTGYRTEVDLGYSKEIVDKLNEKEGYNRYKEIPLRDQ